MSDPTRDDVQDERLARLEAAVGITPPTPTPSPTPEPTPAPAGKPAKPTGLACVITTDGRPTLTWNAAADATAWDVVDLANSAKQLQETVETPRTVRSALKPGQHRRYVIVAVGPTGLRSDPSDPIDIPATDTPAPAPSPTPAPGTGARYPGDIAGKNWYLTLPTGTQGSPDTVKQPALATYSSKYFELTPARDGILFRVWHGGVTTSGSPNPRSELRECNADGSLAKWPAARGRHSMTVEGQVNRLTKVRPHVVLWQCHGASDDVVVFRLEGTSLWLTDGDNTHAHLVTDAFKLGERYTLRGEFVDGVARFTYNGQPIDWQLNVSDPGCYWKAGNYLQSNPKSAPGESTSEWAEVVVYDVDVTHSS